MKAKRKPRSNRVASDDVLCTRYIVHVGVGIYYNGPSLQEATESFFRWANERPRTWVWLEESNKLLESGKPAPVLREPLTKRTMSA